MTQIQEPFNFLSLLFKKQTKYRDEHNEHITSVSPYLHYLQKKQQGIYRYSRQSNLDNLNKESKEEDFTVFSKVTRENVRKISDFLDQLQYKIDRENKQNILKDLHQTLDNLHEECEEEGFEVFSEVARNNARKVLDFLYDHFPQYEYDIYPTEDREIAVDCDTEKGGVLVLCDSEKSLAYFATFDHKNSHFRCDHFEEFYYPLQTVYKKLNPVLISEHFHSSTRLSELSEDKNNYRPKTSLETLSQDTYAKTA